MTYGFDPATATPAFLFKAKVSQATASYEEGRPSFYMECKAVYVANDGSGIGYPSFTTYQPSALDVLERFEIYCYGSSTHYDSGIEWKQGFFYARYGDVYAIDLDRAESMVKVLKKVQNGVQKHGEKYGSISSFGLYAAVVGGLVGVKSIVVEHPEGGGGLYPTGARYRIMSLGDGAGHIQHAWSQFVSAQRQLAAV